MFIIEIDNCFTNIWKKNCVKIKFLTFLIKYHNDKREGFNYNKCICKFDKLKIFSREKGFMNEKMTTLIRTKRRKISPLPYLLLFPSLILATMFSFYPFVKTIVSSFSVTTATGEWIRWNGFDNWKVLLSGERFWKVLEITFKFAALNLALTFPGAMILALIGEAKGKGQRLIQTLFSLPMAIASAPAAAVWLFVFRLDGGLLNGLLGTNIAWLADEKTALICVALVTSWTHIPSSFVLLLAGFRNVPNELLEAATLDGANAITKIFKVKLPLASPQIFYVLFVNIITALRTFTQINLLTAGGPGGSTTTLMYEVYYNANTGGLFELACCDAFVMFIVIFVATRIQFLFEDKMVHYQ